ALGQFHGRPVVVGRRGVDQLARLLFQRPAHGRMAMAETVYRPSLDEIQVSLAGVILEPRTFASHEDKLRTRNDIHQSSHTSPIKFHVDFPYEQKKVSGTEPLAEEILARPYRAI